MPLWIAYLLFDFCFVVVNAVAVTAITASQIPYWYDVGYLFPVLCLYGLAAILMSYIISTVATSQLAAFGYAAGAMALMLALSILTFAVGVARPGPRLHLLTRTDRRSLHTIHHVGVNYEGHDFLARSDLPDW
jgi:hypothetical protein